jgi:hypothetical protein
MRRTGLVAGGVDGLVYVFDLHEAESTARLQVVRPPSADSGRPAGVLSPLTAMDLSGAKQELLATGDVEGVVRIYTTGAHPAVAVARS